MEPVAPERTLQQDVAKLALLATVATGVQYAIYVGLALVNIGYVILYGLYVNPIVSIVVAVVILTFLFRIYKRHLITQPGLALVAYAAVMYGVSWGLSYILSLFNYSIFGFGQVTLYVAIFGLPLLMLVISYFLIRLVGSKLIPSLSFFKPTADITVPANPAAVIQPQAPAPVGAPQAPATPAPPAEQPPTPPVTPPPVPPTPPVA